MRDQCRPSSWRRASSFVGARSCRLFFMIVALTSAVGCGGYKAPRFEAKEGSVPIKGVVTIDGKATESVNVTFVAKDVAEAAAKKGEPIGGPTGTTDANGQFSVTYMVKDDGLVPGDYKVYFQWLPPGAAALYEEPDQHIPPAIASKFPPNMVPFNKKYKAGSSDMVDFKVEAGKPQTEVKFDLVTK